MCFGAVNGGVSHINGERHAKRNAFNPSRSELLGFAGIETAEVPENIVVGAIADLVSKRVSAGLPSLVERRCNERVPSSDMAQCRDMASRPLRLVDGLTS